MHDMQIKAGAPLITSPGPSGTTTGQSGQTQSRRLLYLALSCVTLPVYVADQLTKVWAVANLEPGSHKLSSGQSCGST